MEVGLIFKIAAVGILVTILSQVLKPIFDANPDAVEQHASLSV